MTTQKRFFGVFSFSSIPSFYLTNWSFFFLLLIGLVFSWINRVFFSPTNLQDILYASVILVLLAAAETPVIITGGIDLSVGFVMGLSAVSVALVIRILYEANYSIVASILIGITFGLLLCLIPGLISGILIAWFKVPPFIATLGIYGIANGVALKLSGGFPVSGLPSVITEWGNSYFAYWWPEHGISFFEHPPKILPHQLRELIGIGPVTVLFCIVGILILRFVMNQTAFGQHLFAIGGNFDAALRAGIDVKKKLLMVYVLSSFLAGIAGIVSLFQLGVGHYTPFSASYELFAISAVVIGGASLMGGKGKIMGSVIGVLLLVTIENGLAIAGLQPFFRYIAVGIILIVAVIIDELFPELF